MHEDRRFVDLLGTSDALEVSRRAEAGDEACRRAWDAMVYQICKEIGAMAAALGGNVDGILLGGGMVHNKGLVLAIKRRCGWIAPVFAYPGACSTATRSRSATRASPSSTASPASRAEGNPVREHKSPCGPRPVP